MKGIRHNVVNIETGDGTVHAIELTDDEQEAHKEAYRSNTLQHWATEILRQRGLAPLDNAP